jgi:hypothetical protein
MWEVCWTTAFSVIPRVRATEALCPVDLGVVRRGGQLRRRRVFYADRPGTPPHLQAFVVSQA